MKLAFLEFLRIGKKKWVFLWFLTLLGAAIWISGLLLDRTYKEKGCALDDYLSAAAEYEGLPINQMIDDLKAKNERLQQVFMSVIMYRFDNIKYEEASARLSACGYNETNPNLIDIEQLNRSQACYTLLYQNMDLQNQYASYLTSLKKGTSGLSGLSLFSNDIYAVRTKEKVMRDYAELNASVDIWHHNTAAREFLQNRVIDGASFLFLITILLLLFTDEREKEYNFLTGTTSKGKQYFYLKKLSVLFIYTCITIIVYESGLLLYYQYRTGLVRWNVPIQSITSFSMCPKSYSIMQAVLITVLTKILFFYVLLQLLSVFACLCSKTIQFLGMTAIITAASVIWMINSSVNAAFGWLTYLNPVNLTDTARLFLGYRNINILEYPVSALHLVNVVTGAEWIAGLLSGCILYGRIHRCKIIWQKKKEKEGRQHFHRMPLFFLELYKVLKSYRFWIPLCLAFIGFSVYYVRSSPITLSVEERFYEDYMRELNGPLTPEKVFFLQTEAEKFSQLEELQEQLHHQDNQTFLLSYIEQLLRERDAFRTVEQRFARMQASEGVSVFLYETGYLHLFGIRPNEKGRLGLLFGIILLTLFAPWFFWIEWSNGAAALIRTTLHGKKRQIMTQYSTCCLLTLSIHFPAYIGEIYYIFRQFGTYGLGEKLSNIAEMQSFPITMSISSYLFLMQLIRICGVALALFLAMASMYLCRDYLKTALICSVLMLLPYLLYINGFSFMNGYFLNAFLTGNEFLLLIQDKETEKLILIGIQSMLCLGLSAAVVIREVRSNEIGNETCYLWIRKSKRD